MNKAKEIFSKENHACVLVGKSGTRISDARGIKQLFEWSTDMSGADIADKIVGYAAAAIMVEFGVRAVYGEIMSEPAAKCFLEHEINFEYGELVENIKNRIGDGICPMEQTALGKGTNEAVMALQEKIGNLGKKS